MIIEVKQGSDAWLTCRLGKFTASTAQTIATNGKGLETLVFEKVAELMTGKPKDAYTNPDMDRGVELEAEARNSYELTKGTPVNQVGFFQLDDNIGCSPDGLVGTDGLVEIKCPNNVTFVRYMYDQKIDPGYYAQMQMQMWVTDRQWCDYVVYNPNFEMSTLITRVERDEAKINEIKAGVQKGIELLNKIMGAIK